MNDKVLKRHFVRENGSWDRDVSIMYVGVQNVYHHRPHRDYHP